MKSSRFDIARLLANAFLAGPWTLELLVQRAVTSLGARRGWAWPLAEHVLAAFAEPPFDARDALASFIDRDEKYQDAWRVHQVATRVLHLAAPEPRMRERRWPVVPLATAADLWTWLDVPENDLAWLADRKGFERFASDGPLQNYHYQWVPKQSGGVRLLEAPKGRLKRIQRKILTDILEHLPVHDAAHGFRKGRSILTHSRLHVSMQTVLRFDLRAFFADVPPGRAYGVFRKAGYPEDISRTLIALCTNRVPWSVLREMPKPRTSAEVGPTFRLRQRLSAYHLPQGAPTSPALANLCAFGLDIRLRALAAKVGAEYSRYADDLTFSGDSTLGGAGVRLARHVAEIVRDEGFSLHPDKTRVMRASQCQRVTGVVVNEGVNVSRREYDLLKATLYNAARWGPEVAARGRPHFQAYLRGKLGWVAQLSPARAAKLQVLFDRIPWSER